MSLTVKLMLSPLLVAQVVLTRARLPRLGEPLGGRSGVVGQGAVLRLLIAGDSSAAGVGVPSQRQALARPLAQRLAQACAAQVHWRLLAQSGLTTAQIGSMLQARFEDPSQGAALAPADLAVVVTGVNDVIDQVPSQRAVAAREALANRLRNAHAVQHVVFAPLPPIHHFPGLPQPLRWVAGADAKRHNAALRRWCASRSDVSCVDMEMPLNPGVMARDGFHPGEPVYRYCAGAIAQHIARHVWPLLHQPAGA
jgi:lysophospholipase L1-like esterase